MRTRPYSTPNKQALGQQAEQRTAQWLQERGWHIAQRNWRHGRLEIDLIAHKAGMWLAVEVKYLQNPDEDAQTWIRPLQIDRLKRAMLAYAVQHHIRHWQLDLIVWCKNLAQPMHHSTLYP